MRNPTRLEHWDEESPAPGVPWPRNLRIFEHRPDLTGLKRKLPRHAFFFLVDDENSDVFASADALKLNEFERLVSIWDGALVVYDGPIKPIRNRAFVSLRALGAGREEWEKTRLHILESFRACGEFADDDEFSRPLRDVDPEP
jgi:hypothetical protein